MSSRSECGQPTSRRLAPGGVGWLPDVRAPTVGLQRAAALLRLAADQGAMPAQLPDPAAPPPGWCNPAFAHFLKAPLRWAPEAMEFAQPHPLRQAAIYSALRTATLSQAAFDLLAARASFIVRLDSLHGVLLPSQVATARCSPVHGTALLRSWLGAWATAHKQQEGFLPCPLGCHAPAAFDRLDHLLSCALLWSAASRATGLGSAATPRCANVLRTQ